MPQNQPHKILAFSTKGDGLLRALINEVGISEAYDINQPQSKLPKALTWKAIWDTGATNSVITQKVVDALGLKPITRTQVRSVHGIEDVPVFLVCIHLPNALHFPVVRVTLGELPDVDVLIGMDIILTGDFAVSNHQGKTTFSFRFPSCEEIDFVKDIAKLNAAAERNKVPTVTSVQKRKARNKSKKARKDRRSR